MPVILRTPVLALAIKYLKTVKQSNNVLVPGASYILVTGTSTGNEVGHQHYVNNDIFLIRNVATILLLDM
jgi:hypothetical protein